MKSKPHNVQSYPIISHYGCLVLIRDEISDIRHVNRSTNQIRIQHYLRLHLSVKHTEAASK